MPEAEAEMEGSVLDSGQRRQRFAVQIETLYDRKRADIDGSQQPIKGVQRG